MKFEIDAHDLAGIFGDQVELLRREADREDRIFTSQLKLSEESKKKLRDSADLLEKIADALRI